MSTSATYLADSLLTLGEAAGQIEVRLSNQLVRLLSEQLYQSPHKAIEELVVNSFDADAAECRVFVPDPSDHTQQFVIVFDDGTGMDRAGLAELWRVGDSPKRRPEVESRLTRKQIGKFGIGKLATYAIADQITYMTRKTDEILSVTLNYARFSSDPTGTGAPVPLRITRLKDTNALQEDPRFRSACASVGVDHVTLLSDARTHWTFSVLEELKPKVRAIQKGRLRWVLSTAMPLRTDFRLFLNKEEVTSSNEDKPKVAEFTVSDLPDRRVEALSQATGKKWEKNGEYLISPSFPNGICGDVLVAQQPLEGKSDDLGRSYGLFVRVRGRLVNEDDALFGLEPLTHETFLRMSAEVSIDDLDDSITASREGVGSSDRLEETKTVLRAIFNEARARFTAWQRTQETKEEQAKEDNRNWVNPHLVERPIADVLVASGSDLSGADADDQWFYMQLNSIDDTARRDLIRKLYETQRSEQLYQYEYLASGPTGRLVRFDPSQALFVLNSDHELVSGVPRQSSREGPA